MINFSLGHSYSKIDMSNIIDQNDSLHLSREDKNKMVSPYCALRIGDLFGNVNKNMTGYLDSLSRVSLGPYNKENSLKINEI